MPEWLWGTTFIVVLLAVAWVADWRTKRHYLRPARVRLIRSSPAGGAATRPRASS
jgi:hypothetical protein